MNRFIGGALGKKRPEIGRRTLFQQARATRERAAREGMMGFSESLRSVLRKLAVVTRFAYATDTAAAEGPSKESLTSKIR
jgi:hypothetical protein